MNMRGLGASPGKGRGPVVFRPDDTNDFKDPVVLVCRDIDADDRAALANVCALVLVRAGLTGDNPIMARALEKPCVVALEVELSDDCMISHGEKIPKGTWVTVDGRTGAVAVSQD